MFAVVSPRYTHVVNHPLWSRFPAEYTKGNERLLHLISTPWMPSSSTTASADPSTPGRQPTTTIQPLHTTELSSTFSGSRPAELPSSSRAAGPLLAETPSPGAASRAAARHVPRSRMRHNRENRPVRSRRPAAAAAATSAAPAATTTAAPTCSPGPTTPTHAAAAAGPAGYAATVATAGRGRARNGPGSGAVVHDRRRVGRGRGGGGGPRGGDRDAGVGGGRRRGRYGVEGVGSRGRDRPSHNDGDVVVPLLGAVLWNKQVFYQDCEAKRVFRVVW